MQRDRNCRPVMTARIASKQLFPLCDLHTLVALADPDPSQIENCAGEMAKVSSEQPRRDRD